MIVSDQCEMSDIVCQRYFGHKPNSWPFLGEGKLMDGCSSIRWIIIIFCYGYFLWRFAKPSINTERGDGPVAFNWNCCMNHWILYKLQWYESFGRCQKANSIQNLSVLSHFNCCKYFRSVLMRYGGRKTQSLSLLCWKGSLAGNR